MGGTKCTGTLKEESEGVLVNNFVLGGKPRRLDLHFNEVDSDGLPSLNVRSGVIFRRKAKIIYIRSLI